LFGNEDAMPPLANLLLVIALLSWTSLAAAQNTLGAVLDAGGKVMSAEEFRNEVVQRTVTGPTAAGGSHELMYVASGSVEGAGIPPDGSALVRLARIYGSWTSDDRGRVCTSMRIGPEGGGSTSGTSLPSSCVYWFKLGDKYFLSGSDSDRSAKVLSRTVKP
jgi:hypothetical protein